MFTTYGEFSHRLFSYALLYIYIKVYMCVCVCVCVCLYRYAGECGEIVAMETFGLSAPAGKLFPHFGFTAENVAEKALASIEKTK